jgi:hypothetical protein
LTRTHHAGSKHAKEQCFNDQAQNDQELLGPIETGILRRHGRRQRCHGHFGLVLLMMMMMSPVVDLHTGRKACNNQRHGIGAGQKRVKDKE